MHSVLIRKPRMGLLFGALVTSVGCSSIASRLYDADGDGQRHAKCLHGIPTTVDVPTHVQVAIIETQYVRLVPDATTRATTYVAGEVFGMKNTRRLDYGLVTMKELYTVDFKRPAAGTNDLKLTFAPDVSNGQYFSKIEQTLSDVTIDKVTALIQAVINSAPTLSGLGKVVPKSDPAVPANMIAVDKVIAVEFFEIRQVNLAGQIQTFLEQHVNACSPCPATGGMPACRQALPVGVPGPVLPPPNAVPALPGSVLPQPNPIPASPDPVFTRPNVIPPFRP